MICEHCHGSGKEPRKDANGTSRYTNDPCCECGGSGIAHCCDGICEQPDGTSNNAASLRRGNIVNGGGLLDDCSWFPYTDAGR